MPDLIFAAEPQPPPNPPLISSDLGFDDLTSQFNNIPIPSMDSLFDDNALPTEAFASDLDFAMDFGDNDDFEITFDDVDNLCFPPDDQDFLLPDAYNSFGASISPISDVNSKSPESGNSAISGDNIYDISRFLNSQVLDSVSFKEEISPANNSGNQDRLNSVDVKASSLWSPDSEEECSNGPVSSHGSWNDGSGVYEAMNSPSLSFDHYRSISSRAHENDDKGVTKTEEIGRGCDLKRKKELSEESAETKTTQYRRSSSVHVENEIQQCVSAVNVNGINGEEEKRKARLTRNRESAQLSRKRKKHYVEELEEKVKAMNSTIADLSSKISFFMAENATLRQQLGAGGVMYPNPPMAPMPYPWIPCAPYIVKPHGSQVPLVPIPRLRPQNPAAAPKSKKQKPESKKSEAKTKKVASISLLGLFFFIMLFGGLVPLVDVKFGGLVNNLTGRSSYVIDRWVYGQDGGKGKVWPVNGGHRNGSERDEDVRFSDGRFSISDRRNYERQRKLEESHERHDLHLDESVRPGGNASEPLVASLYVPRNDKLVKIDGNLIIHSIMASEKTMASQTAAQVKKVKRETGLAIPNSALAIPEAGRNSPQHPHVYRVSPEQRKALGSGSTKTLKDHMKSSATDDGKMQQWFHEGLAGPMLSSGMCTEVFQFDVSPTPGAIVPATSVVNISSENRRNATTLNKSRNRRILHGLPYPLPGSKLNLTEDRIRKSKDDPLHGNSSSMVVSVLVDPKEAADVNVDGVMTPKSLSRIFVVVLMDSVKYVTYSCGLPRASHHLVAASSSIVF
ncbi:PREDICTED: bZIP transcription factor 17-like isoform X2 [Lupinus angustifolius]|uniref:bZIP transcription factor 17-like isoform X2 n=1 Tax=Lupinus angustifolius TaxID=3871 RepID=UPI00092E45AF|nr:PREDICTED: bZIP transcription factor 17-like isoform X2 [Lupinus angustifolius]